MFSASQQKLVSYFQNAVATDTVRQMYIIKGEAGLGKKEVLKKISQYIMCQNGTGCGRCNSCESLALGANPDCIRISNGDKKTIELQKIRDMIKEVYIKPVRSKYKLFIIENAHLMDDAPQNALLKVIEEPPLYAVFVLLCDNLNSILPTILSRAMTLELERSSVDDLKRICPLPKENEYMYTYSLGNIGALKAISSDGALKDLRDKLISNYTGAMLGDEEAVYDAIDFWLDNKDMKDDMINILVMFLRDVVFYKNSVMEQIANTDKINEIKALSEKLGKNDSFKMLTLANDIPRLMGKYGNFSMAVQTMMISLKQMCLRRK